MFSGRFRRLTIVAGAFFCVAAAFAFLTSGGSGKALAQTSGYKGLTAGARGGQGQETPGYSGYKGLVAPRGTIAPQQQQQQAAPATGDTRGQRIGTTAPETVPGGRLPIARPQPRASDPAPPQVAVAESPAGAKKKGVHKNLKATDILRTDEIVTSLAAQNPAAQRMLARRQQAAAQKNSIQDLATLTRYVTYEKTDNGGYYKDMSPVERGVYPRLDAIMQLLQAENFTDENGRPPADRKARRQLLETSKAQLEGFAEVIEAGNPKDPAEKEALRRITREARFVASEIEKHI